MSSVRGTRLLRQFSGVSPYHSPYAKEEVIEVFTKPFGAPYLASPVPPESYKQKIPLTGELTIDLLAKIITFNLTKGACVVSDAATGQ